jgi:hypothetical protein
MAESPHLTSQSERARQLAERFGMTRADVENVLTETHAEYSGDALPPAMLAPEAPIEQAARATPNAESSAIPSAASTRTQPLSGGFIAVLLTVLLIGLGIALSFRQGCFQQRHEREAAKPVDTIQNMLNNAAEQASSPRPPTNVPPGEVPPEALAVPREEPPANHADHTAASKPTLETSSNFEAEERLAELRANGNSHARMKTIRKGGSISYQVLAK